MMKLFGTNNRKTLLPAVNRLAGCLGLLMACAVLYGQDVPTVPQTPPPDTTSVLPVAVTDDATAQAPAVAPAAVPAEQEPVDTDVVPKQGPVTPNVDQETVASDEVYTVHLRPLFTTVVRLPEAVTSLAVGAPTLIAAEHDKAEPRLVFIKPTTHKKVDSNVIVALQSGHTLAIRVISAGDEGSSDPVDFVVDYSQPRGLMLGSNEVDTPLYPARPSVPAPSPELTPAGRPGSGQLIPVSSPRHDDATPAQQPGRRQAGPSAVVTDQTPVAALEPHGSSKALPLLDSLYQEQLSVAAPHYTTAAELSRIYPEDKNASADLSASLGRCVQTGDNVTLSYSVLNRSERWIEVLPPLLEFNNPSSTKKNGKVDKKHPEALAESLPISDYRMSKTKLAPGERLDGALEFVRPGFKFRKERLLLQIANASEVDTALLVPVPFVPVGHE